MRISKGNSELTGAQWVPSRAVLAYVCPKRPNMGQIGPRDIGADLDFGADLALSILQCRHRIVLSEKSFVEILWVETDSYLSILRDC